MIVNPDPTPIEPYLNTVIMTGPIHSVHQRRDVEGHSGGVCSPPRERLSHSGRSRTTGPNSSACPSGVGYYSLRQTVIQEENYELQDERFAYPRAESACNQVEAEAGPIVP